MKNLIEKASQQILCEELGFDEGKLYYWILTKKEKNIKKEFSYSKKYRILKNLFQKGAVGKLKDNKKDFFTYVPLPPTFLFIKDANKEVISFLEKVYLKNHKKFLEKDFIQIILKNEKSLILFMLKYFMNENAKIEGINFKEIPKKDKIQLIERKDNKKRGIIDKKLEFELIPIKNHVGFDYIGYISNKTSNKT